MDTLEKCYRAGQARDDIMQRMRFAYSITKATDAPSAYAIPTTFPRQQWLCERASILCVVYISCLFACLNVFWYVTGKHLAAG